MKRILFFLISCFLPTLIWAGMVTEQDVLQKTKHSLQGRQLQTTFKSKARSSATSGFGSSFHVFNDENQGDFVMVSGDGRTDEILSNAESGEVKLDISSSRFKAEKLEGNVGDEFVFPVDGIDMTFTVTSETTVKVGKLVGDRKNRAVDANLANGKSIVIPETITVTNEKEEKKSYSVTEIGAYSFFNIQLSSITLPSKLEKIDDYAITDNYLLSSLIIPASVTSIKSQAIRNCPQITSFYVESDNKVYDSRDNCNALIETMSNTLLLTTEATTSIPSTVKVVAKYAFSGAQMESVVLPSSVERIDPWAFVDNRNITKLVIPASVTEIGSGMIINCPNLKTLTVDVGNTKYYSDCNGIIEKSTNTLVVGTQGTEKIPSGVTGIGAYAFLYMKAINLTISKDISMIGTEAFSNCSGCVFTVESSTPLKIEDDVFWGVKENNCKLIVPVDSKKDYVNAPGWQQFGADNIIEGETLTEFRAKVSGVEVYFTITGDEEVKVGHLAGSYDNPSIPKSTSGSVVLPSTVEYEKTTYKVTAIGDYAFAYTNISSVTIPETIKTIGVRAFEGCSKQNLTIPQTVDEIGKGAFAYCSECMFTVERETPLEIDDDVFERAGYNNSFLVVPAGKSDIYAKATGWKQFGENIMEVGDDLPITDFSEPIMTFSGKEVVVDDITYVVTTPKKGQGVAMVLSVPSTMKGTIQIPYNINFKLSENGTGRSYTDLKPGEKTESKACDNTDTNEYSCVVTALGNDLFKDRVDIYSIELLGPITSVWPGVFENCKGLGSIVLPYNVVYLASTFKGCESLNFVRINGTLSSIPDNTFSGCSNLASLYLSDDLVSIGNGAFENCKNLNPLDFGKGLQVIGDNAFKGCSSLEKLVIPDNVTTIGNGAFDGCSALKSLSLGKGLISIGEKAFTSESLKNVNIKMDEPIAIPENVFSAVAYQNATLLVPTGQVANYQETMGWKNFSIITDVEQTDFADGETFEAETIEGVVMTFKVISAAEKTVQVGTGENGNAGRAIKQETIGSLTIPETVKGHTVVTLADCSLRNCFMLSSITIPKSVTSIVGSAIEACNGLSSITVDDGNQSYCSVDGILFDKNKETLLMCPSRKKLEKYDVPDGVKTIGSWAFGGNEYLQKITFPSGLTTIGDHAFMDCYNLTTVNYSKSVTEIGHQAFAYCTGIQDYNVDENNPNYSSIKGVLFSKDQKTIIQFPGGREGRYDIPNQVTHIATSAFGAVNLLSLSIPSGVEVIDLYAFTDCQNLKAIYCNIENPSEIHRGVFERIENKTILYVPKGTKPNYLAAGGWDILASIMENNGVTYAVYDNADNTDVSVTVIDAEKNDDGQYSIVPSVKVYDVDTPVSGIAARAFENVTSMRGVTIPASVTSIGEKAFEGCSGLEEILCLNPVPVDLSVSAVRGQTKKAPVVSQFDGVSNCTLYVLKDSKNDYKDAAGWNAFTIKGFAGLGDVNADEGVNVTDVVNEVDYILGKNPSGFLYGAGDLNTDKSIDVTDVVAIVNKILGRSNARGVGATEVVSTQDDVLSLIPMDDGSLSLCLDNVGSYMAAQFDVHLSGGQTLEHAVKGIRSKQHQLATSQIGDNLYRVILYSMGEAQFVGQSGEVVNLAVAGEGSVKIENITFVTCNSESMHFAPLNVGTTGICEMDITNKLGHDWYDLNGRKLNNMPNMKGVYILGGKKTVVR